MTTVLTLDETARFLRVHPSTIYRMVKNRQIPAFKMGSDWRFNQDSIEHWIRQRETADSHRKIVGEAPIPIRRNGH